MLEPFAFYWVRLNEPDGPSWIVARFIETKLEFWDYWNNRPSQEDIAQNYWALCGKADKVRQVQTPGASNRWKIGPRLLPPCADGEFIAAMLDPKGVPIESIRSFDAIEVQRPMRHNPAVCSSCGFHYAVDITRLDPGCPKCLASLSL